MKEKKELLELMQSPKKENYEERKQSKLVRKLTIDHLHSKSPAKEKIIKCIQRTRIFNIIFLSNDRVKASIYRSRKYGAIF